MVQYSFLRLVRLRLWKRAKIRGSIRITFPGNFPGDVNTLGEFASARSKNRNNPVPHFPEISLET